MDPISEQREEMGWQKAHPSDKLRQKTGLPHHPLDLDFQSEMGVPPQPQDKYSIKANNPIQEMTWVEN